MRGVQQIILHVLPLSTSDSLQHTLPFPSHLLLFLPEPCVRIGKPGQEFSHNLQSHRDLKIPRLALSALSVSKQHWPIFTCCDVPGWNLIAWTCDLPPSDGQMKTWQQCSILSPALMLYSEIPGGGTDQRIGSAGTQGASADQIGQSRGQGGTK
jgi:hypothetical protein